mmetsp:Transcript_4345/g.8561  ORF Transcript_4345/g.8561 Transcript_4345/m.8561 type:complete len:532 (-) Transcript_4345:476-2071(-)
MATPDLSIDDGGTNWDEVRYKAARYAELGVFPVARFLADKAVAIAEPCEGRRADALIVARTAFHAGDAPRALHVLRSEGIDGPAAPEGNLLAAQCLFVMRKWEDCLETLGPSELDATPTSDVLGHQPAEVRAARCLVRGMAFEQLDHGPRAIEAYADALRCDRFCVEAARRLSDGGLVEPVKRRALILPDGDEVPPWLNAYYDVLANVGLFETDAENRALGCMESAPGLSTSVDFLAIRARALFEAQDFHAALVVGQRAFSLDPYHREVLTYYLACLCELGTSQALFSLGHRLVNENPKSSLSWLAVGYYYMSCEKFELARRYFHKATSLDPRLAAAWLAFGHAFAAQDESDQAMAAYRTASRLFPGAHLPLVYIGAEYARQSSFSHSIRFFRYAMALSPLDPAPVHELGVVSYRCGKFREAIEHFEHALALSNRGPKSEATLFNLAHCHRRVGQLGQASKLYELCLVLSPQRASTHTALGLTQHAMGKLSAAASTYHTALRLSPEESIASSLLERCLREMTDPSRPFDSD